MKPPFIVDDSGDLSIFETLEEAERYLEPNDVEPGKCLAYDSEGCCFEGFDESKWFRHRVRLRPREGQPTHAPELLRDQLLYVLGGLETKETHEQLASLPLHELVAVAVEHLVRRGH